MDKDFIFQGMQNQLAFLVREFFKKRNMDANNKNHIRTIAEEKNISAKILFQMVSGDYNGRLNIVADTMAKLGININIS